MTNEKLLEVIRHYENEVDGALADAIDENFHDRAGDLEHVIEMLAQMRGFVREDRREKVMRWLGFVQGVLWVHQVYTIKELKDHNKPNDECAVD